MTVLDQLIAMRNLRWYLEHQHATRKEPSMRTQKESTSFPIEVKDCEGNVTEREVEVYIDFSIYVDNQYGADADGNRGTRLVECEIDDIYLLPEVERTLLEEEKLQVLHDAEERFEKADKHY